jgi:hypothetical protein
MGMLTKVIGRMAKWRVRGNIIGLMVIGMRGNINMARDMDMGFMNGILVILFNRSNGNIYKGYWKDGNQSGEGEYYNNRFDVWVKKIWEEGRPKEE